jgi:hypothetical protein
MSGRLCYGSAWLLVLFGVWTAAEALEALDLPPELRTHAFYYCW